MLLLENSITPLLLLIAVCSYQTEGRRCFQCSNVPHPRDCVKVETCGPGETCYTEEVVKTSGTIVYNSGCIPTYSCHAGSGVIGRRSLMGRSSDITTCIDCCDGDFCNNQGCTTQAVPRDQRGPYCFTCDSTRHPSDCEEVSVCQRNQFCALYTPRNFLGLPEDVYTGECTSAQMCHGLMSAHMGTVCQATCCDTDFCNDHCNASAAVLPTTHTTQTTLTTQTTSPTTTSPPGLQCPNDHHQDVKTGLCIKVVTDHNVTWAGAQAACAAMGDNLVTIDSLQKNDLVEQVITATQNVQFAYWIGGRDIHDTSTFYWTDGHQFSYTNWGGHDDVYKNQQPDDSSHDPQNCVMIIPRDHYRWHDNTCWIGDYGYICEYSDVRQPVTPSYVCNTYGGYKSVGDGLCLRIHSGQGVHWTQAKALCEKEGTGLVLLETLQKAETLRQYVNHYDSKHHSSFWIGGQDRFKNNTFYWENGQRFSADTDWDKKKHQPDHYSSGHDEDCVIMYGGSDHYMHDAKCTSNYDFICQRS